MASSFLFGVLVFSIPGFWRLELLQKQLRSRRCRHEGRAYRGQQLYGPGVRPLARHHQQKCARRLHCSCLDNVLQRWYGRLLFCGFGVVDCALTHCWLAFCLELELCRVGVYFCEPGGRRRPDLLDDIDRVIALVRSISMSDCHRDRDAHGTLCPRLAPSPFASSTTGGRSTALAFC